jgi:regulator of replication initiation timing
MDVPVLMHKLMEIERALNQHDECAARNLLIATQDGVLALERENETLAIENAGLRQRLNATRHATVPYAAHSRSSLSAADSSPMPARRQILSADSESSPALEPCGAPEPDDSRPPHTWRITHFFFS